MTGPLVSIVIAVRDSERFIESSVRSALAQTYSPLEIVVVDDGSRDRTGEILERMRDPRMRVLRTAGIGSARAKNLGMRETAGRIDQPPSANLPAWAQLQQDLRARGMLAPPVEVVDDDGAVLPALQQVLEVVADHGMLLATGHLSRDEIFAVVDAAVGCGVRDIVITHPDFPSQDLSIEDQLALARKGALLERCFVTFHTGKAPWERMVAGIRATGVENNVLSSDLGQRRNPPVEDGLPLMADRMLAAGFSEDEVRTVTVTNTRRVAGLEVLV